MNRLMKGVVVIGVGGAIVVLVFSLVMAILNAPWLGTLAVVALVALVLAVIFCASELRARRWDAEDAVKPCDTLDVNGE